MNITLYYKKLSKNYDLQFFFESYISHTLKNFTTKPRNVTNFRECYTDVKLYCFFVSAIRHYSSLSKCPEQKQSPPGKNRKCVLFRGVTASV
jgi:hypothetical protein